MKSTLVAIGCGLLLAGSGTYAYTQTVPQPEPVQETRIVVIL